MPTSMGLAGKYLGVSNTFSTDANFSLVLIDKDTGEKKQTYTFYVSPDQVTIQMPGRVQVYQTARGAAHVDHMGAGLSSVIIAGQTGLNPLVGNPGLVQYRLLRQLVESYFDLCENAVGPNSVELQLTISYKDNPNFGRWPVTIKDFTMTRSIQKPLENRYALSMIIIGRNIYSSKKPTSKRTAPDTAAVADVTAAKQRDNMVPDKWFDYIVPKEKVTTATTVTESDPGSGLEGATVYVTTFREFTFTEILVKVYPGLFGGAHETSSSAASMITKVSTDIMMCNGIQDPSKKFKNGDKLKLYVLNLTGSDFIRLGQVTQSPD